MLGPLIPCSSASLGQVEWMLSSCRANDDIQLPPRVFGGMAVDIFISPGRSVAKCAHPQASSWARSCSTVVSAFGSDTRLQRLPAQPLATWALPVGPPGINKGSTCFLMWPMSQGHWLQKLVLDGLHSHMGLLVMRNSTFGLVSGPSSPHSTASAACSLCHSFPFKKKTLLLTGAS